MKSTTVLTPAGPLHIDFADGATPEDVEAITRFAQQLRRDQERMQADFEQLWSQFNAGDRGNAFEWFKIGYELSQKRSEWLLRWAGAWKQAAKLYREKLQAEQREQLRQASLGGNNW